MASVYERISSALSSLGKRRERDGGSQEGAGGRTPSASPAARALKRFRPWEQSDLHRRLETYKPLTWFAKPASVGPIPCALRGWLNEGCDTLGCEYCGARLIYPPQVPYDQRQAAADMFSPSLTTKHGATCPWRQTACNTSLLAYVPSSPPDQLCDLFTSLSNKLLRVDVLPDLCSIAIQTIRNAAAPFGPYEDLVLGGGGALTVRRPPSATITELGGGSAAAAAGPSDGDTTTLIVQPSKLSPQQKAKLLALLGWDVDVLQPESAAGAAAAPYAQSAGYSLGHLGVAKAKPRAGSGGAAVAGAAAVAGGAGAACGDSGGGGGAGGRYPMSSVVLKCAHCNGRMGLWNFSGVRPVPTGRLTPAQHAAGAAALLGSRASVGGGAAAGGGATSAAAAADPLSATIAGGTYALHGGGGPRPFGAASATPFRFGSAAATAPVFGVAAFAPPATMASSSQQRPGGGGGASGTGFGFGGLPSAPSTPVAARPPLAPAAAAGSLAGHKRKAPEAEQPSSAAEPMAVDDPQSQRQDQAAGPSGAAAAAAGDGGKRQRMGSYGSYGGASTAGAAGVPASPGPMGRFGGADAAGAAGAGAGQLRDLDPLCQHRSWCPWVYTGSGEEQHMSGWQHMLSALAQQGQAQAQGAAAGAAGAAGADGQEGGEGGAAARDHKQLRDSVLATIRAL